MRKIVRKLTLRRSQWRSFDATSLPISWQHGILALLLALTCGSSAAETQAWQTNADITAAAESYVRARTGKSENRTSVQASSLDPRHRLPLCDQALEPFMRRGAKIADRTIVGVRCKGSRPWQVYVPVYVTVTARVLTARQALPRDHLLTEADLVIDEREVSRLTSGYMSNKDQLIGQRLKQQVIAGRIITRTMLKADFIVMRGQTVTLLAAGTGLRISMSGKALIDGALGQRIRVENVNSGRIVEGIVRSAEHVEILLPNSNEFFNAKPKVSPHSADTQVSNNDR